MKPERLKTLRSLPPQKFALVHECILYIDELQRRLDDPLENEVQALRHRVKELQDAIYRFIDSPENSPRLPGKQVENEDYKRRMRQKLQDALISGDREQADLLTRAIVLRQRNKGQAAGS